MWLTLITGRIVSIWRGLPSGVKGFILGTVVGTTLLSVSCSGWRTAATKERIAAENLKASLDSTRALSAEHDTIFARLIAQKDVELAGALAKAAKKQGDKPKSVVGVKVTGTEVRADTSHKQASGPIADSLVLSKPPITGVVKATVKDSTWFWSARLRPSPVDVTVAVGCGKAGPEVLVDGPDWATVNIGANSTVSPNVCHQSPSKWWSGFKSGVVVSGATYVAIRVVGSILTKGK